MASDPDLDRYPTLKRGWDRRQFIRNAIAGTAVVAIGGALFQVCDDHLTREARREKLPDGRPRLPPGQKVLEALRPMGGDEGDGNVRDFQLRVHGHVQSPFTLDYAQLLALPQVTRTADVHCVTGWSLLGSQWKGVQISHLAALAGLKPGVRHVIFEAAHGYTANVPLAEATADDALVTYRMNGKPFPLQHGAPVRGLIPALYFWKSAKWLTGIKFVDEDDPGFWEVRGYHNHADPWKEERYG